MRAAVVREVGQTPAISEDMETPTPREGQVAVAVELAALNPTDLIGAAGIRGTPKLPLVPGTEGVGRTHDGRRVYFDRAVPPNGTFGEVAIARADSLIDLPDDVDSATALKAGIAATTARVALEWKASLEPGERVLVLGATGAVGQVGVQVAKLLGAETVIAAGRHAATLDALRGMGADQVVEIGENLTEQLTTAAPDGVDVVLDTVFGQPFVDALPSVRVGGRIANVGMLAGRTIELPGLLLKGRDLFCYRLDAVPPEVKRMAFESLCADIGRGSLLVEDTLLELSDIEVAWHQQRSGPHRKQLVRIRPDSDRPAT